MAYIKIFPIKSTVKKAMDYIVNPDKTEGERLVSSFGCAPESAEVEFAMTRERARRMVQDRDGNLARHLIISFKPGEVTDPEMAHRVAGEIVDEVLQGRFEYVLSTHTDKDHIHCHVIFNEVSFVDLHRYRSNKRTYREICRTSNRVCRRYGLGESMPTGRRGRSYKENMEYRRGSSWKARLKYSVDRAVWSSVTWEEFLWAMQAAGYEVRQGKYLAFRAPEQKHFTNVKTLGAYYSEEKIRERLERNRSRANMPSGASRGVRVFAEMSVYIGRNDRPGFDRWARLHNLKESAKTFNYLSEHGLLRFEDFKNHAADVEAAGKAAAEKIRQTEEELAKQTTLRKRCDAYRQCREVVLAEATVPVAEKAEYRRQHWNEYRLHDMILKDLAGQGIHKLPSVEKLQRRQEELEAELDKVKKERQDLLKEEKTLRVVADNFEAMVRDVDGVRVPEKEAAVGRKEEERS